MKNHQKIDEKSIPICSWKKMLQKLTSGRSWAPFGRVWGRSGTSFGRPGVSFGRSWVPPGRFLNVQKRTFCKNGSKMSSKGPFGSILGRFGEDLGRNLGGFGRFYADCRSILWTCGKMRPCCSRAYKLDPRAASRSVTMRGGPPPAW